LNKNKRNWFQFFATIPVLTVGSREDDLALRRLTIAGRALVLQCNAILEFALRINLETSVTPLHLLCEAFRLVDDCNGRLDGADFCSPL
jgi:hypothetical protein